jgi:hypothetical protein
VRLEASTKSHVHKKIHEFFINMAFTMACPNFKKGLKMAFGPLGIKTQCEEFEFKGTTDVAIIARATTGCPEV